MLLITSSSASPPHVAFDRDRTGRHLQTWMESQISLGARHLGSHNWARCVEPTTRHCPHVIAGLEGSPTPAPHR